jgi:hypothetical protein
MFTGKIPEILDHSGENRKETLSSTTYIIAHITKNASLNLDKI